MQEITLTKHISLEAKEVLDYLKAHAIGRENAIKINAIAFQFMKPRRAIEIITEELRASGCPLCSSVIPPFGLFLARNYSEMEGWFRQIESRMRSMAVHRANAIRAMKAQAMREGVQMEMELA